MIVGILVQRLCEFCMFHYPQTSTSHLASVRFGLSASSSLIPVVEVKNMRLE